MSSRVNKILADIAASADGESDRYFNFETTGEIFDVDLVDGMRTGYRQVRRGDVFVCHPTVHCPDFYMEGGHYGPSSGAIHVPVGSMLELAEKCVTEKQPMRCSLASYAQIIRRKDLSDPARQVLEQLRAMGFFVYDEKYLREYGWDELEAAELMEIILHGGLETMPVMRLFDHFMEKFGPSTAWLCMGQSVPAFWNAETQWFMFIPKTLWQIPEVFNWYGEHSQITQLCMGKFQDKQWFALFCRFVGSISTLQSIQLIGHIQYQWDGFNCHADQLRLFVEVIRSTPSTLQSITITNTRCIKGETEVMELVQALQRPEQPIVQLRLTACDLPKAISDRLASYPNVLGRQTSFPSLK